MDIGIIELGSGLTIGLAIAGVLFHAGKHFGRLTEQQEKDEYAKRENSKQLVQITNNLNTANVRLAKLETHHANYARRFDGIDKAIQGIYKIVRNGRSAED